MRFALFMLAGCAERSPVNDSISDDGCDAMTWYADGDGDGYGSPDTSLDACDQPSGYVSDDNDCDDNDAMVYPGAEELCDGTYSDCSDPDFDADGVPPEESDKDGDGYVECVDWQGDATVTGGNDCDDTKSRVSPDATEVCDGIDNNCDGAIDDETAMDATTFYADTDGDGFGDTKSPLSYCEAPEGYTDLDGDCHNTNSTINPGADEIPLNGIDENCDGYDGCDDLNCDGYADVFFPSISEGFYGQIFAGDGASLMPGAALVSCGAYSATSGDVNGDGYPDLVTANASCSSNNIFHGSAAGYTNADAGRLLSNTAVTVRVHDLNQDGFDDVVFNANNDGYAYIHWGSAAGALSSTALSVHGGWGMAIGDTNQDGYDDLLFCSTRTNANHLYYGSSSGYSDTDYDSIDNGYAADCMITDLDGDTWPEIIFSGYSSSGHDIYWGSSEGYSTSNRTNLSANSISYGITTGDYNADGHTDIFFSDYGSTDSYLYYGSSSGYSDADRAAIPDLVVFRSATADINSDGFDDLLVPNTSGRAGVFMGSSDGLSTSADYILDDISSYNISAADLNGDGYWEIILPASDSSNSILYWGSASGWSPDDADTLITNGAYAAPLIVGTDEAVMSN